MSNDVGLERIFLVIYVNWNYLDDRILGCNNLADRVEHQKTQPKRPN